MNASKPEVCSMTSLLVQGEEEGSTPQMAQTDHVVSQNLGLINGLLHSLVQLLAVVTARIS